MKKSFNIFRKGIFQLRNLSFFSIILLFSCFGATDKKDIRNRNLGIAALFASQNQIPTKTFEVKVAFFDEYGDAVTPEIISEEEYKQRLANGELKNTSSPNPSLSSQPKFFGAIIAVVSFVVQATNATVNTIKYAKDKDRKKSPSKGCEVLGGFNTWFNTFQSPVFDTSQDSGLAKPYDYNQSMPEGCMTADVQEIRDVSTGQVFIPTPVNIQDPTISPDGGTFSEAQKITLNTSQTLVAGLKPSFRYTTDGTNPSCFFKNQKTLPAGIVYKEPIQINPGVSFTLKVIACGTAIDTPSSIITKSFSVTGGTVAEVLDDKTYDWGTFTDNNNGTVSFQGNAGTFGGVTYTAQNLLFRKCTQGQTYNAGNNDCTGTGSAPGYGAINVDFCSTGNNNCNGGTDTGVLTSPTGGSTSGAYSSCNSLNAGAGTNGRTNWRVPTYQELKLLIKCTNKTMPTDGNTCGAGNFTAPATPSVFPNTLSSQLDQVYYISSSSFLADGIYYMGFYSGFRGAGNKNFPNYKVRCVSTSP